MAQRTRRATGCTTLGIVSGKLDQFPLADEASRMMTPGGDVATEGRLLIDPCADEPEDVLTVSVTGKLLARGNSLRARTSIGVFGLNRRRLVDARREHIRVILEVIRRMPGQRDVIRDVVLDVFAEPQGVYALVARAMRRRPAAFDL